MEANEALLRTSFVKTWEHNLMATINKGDGNVTIKNDITLNTYTMSNASADSLTVTNSYFDTFVVGYGNNDVITVDSASSYDRFIIGVSGNISTGDVITIGDGVYQSLTANSITHATMHLGNGAFNTVQLLNSSFNNISMGYGNYDTLILDGNSHDDTVSIGSNNHTSAGDYISISNGNNEKLTINNGYYDYVTIGNGANDILTMNGNYYNYVIIGSGSGNTISMNSSSSNVLTIGNGANDALTMNNSNYNYVVMGSGANDTLTMINDYYDYVLFYSNTNSAISMSGSYYNYVIMSGGIGDTLSVTNSNANVISIGTSANSLGLTHSSNNLIKIGNSVNNLNLVNSNSNQIIIGNSTGNQLTMDDTSNNNIISMGVYTLFNPNSAVDTIHIGNGYNNQLIGGNGNFNVTVGNGNGNVIYLGNGNNTIDAGIGSDTVIVGTGRDALIYEAAQNALNSTSSGRSAYAVNNSADTLTINMNAAQYASYLANDQSNISHLAGQVYYFKSINLNIQGFVGTHIIIVPVSTTPTPPTLTLPNNITDYENLPSSSFNIVVGIPNSETFGGVTISGVTHGTFSAGTNNGGGNWSFTQSQLNGLTFIPTTGFQGAVSMGVTALANIGSNSAQATGTLNFNVIVDQPSFVNPITAPQNAVVGSAITPISVVAVDPAGQPLNYVFSIQLPSGLSFDATHHQIIGTPSFIDDLTSPITLTLTVSNGIGGSISEIIQFTFTPAAPIISTASGVDQTTSIVLNGTAQANATVSLSEAINGGSFSALTHVTADSSGNWSLTLNNLTNNTVYDFKATQTVTNNPLASSASNDVSITVHLDIPQVTAITTDATQILGGGNVNTYAGDVIFSESNPNDVLTFNGVGFTNQNNQSYAVVSTPHGVLDIYPDGSFTYQPNTGFLGTDSFNLQVNNGNYSATESETFVVNKLDLSQQANNTIEPDPLQMNLDVTAGMVYVTDLNTATLIEQDATNGVQNLYINASVNGDVFYLNGIYGNATLNGNSAAYNPFLLGGGGSKLSYNDANDSNPILANFGDANSIIVNYDPATNTGTVGDSSTSAVDHIQNFQEIDGSLNGGDTFNLSSINGHDVFKGGGINADNTVNYTNLGATSTVVVDGFEYTMGQLILDTVLGTASLKDASGQIISFYSDSLESFSSFIGSQYLPNIFYVASGTPASVTLNGNTQGVDLNSLVVNDNTVIFETAGLVGGGLGGVGGGLNGDGGVILSGGGAASGGGGSGTGLGGTTGGGSAGAGGGLSGGGSGGPGQITTDIIDLTTAPAWQNIEVLDLGTSLSHPSNVFILDLTSDTVAQITPNHQIEVLGDSQETLVFSVFSLSSILANYNANGTVTDGYHNTFNTISLNGSEIYSQVGMPVVFSTDLSLFNSVIASNVTFTDPENTTNSFSLFTDINNYAILTALPQHGTLEDSTGNPLSLNSFIENGQFIYVPNTGYYGSDSFNFAAKNFAALQPGLTATINITPQTPIVNAETIAVTTNIAGANQSTGFNSSLISDDNNATDTFSYMLNGNPISSADVYSTTLTILDNNHNPVTAGTLVLNTNPHSVNYGDASFTPTADFLGQVTFTLKVTDSTVNLSGSNTETINVNNLNLTNESPTSSIAISVPSTQNPNENADIIITNGSSHENVTIYGTPSITIEGTPLTINGSALLPITAIPGAVFISAPGNALVNFLGVVVQPGEADGSYSAAQISSGLYLLAITNGSSSVIIYSDPNFAGPTFTDTISVSNTVVTETPPNVSFSSSTLTTTPESTSNSLALGLSAVATSGSLTEFVISNISSTFQAAAGKFTENGISVGTWSGPDANNHYKLTITDPTQLANLNSLNIQLPAGYTESFTLSAQAQDGVNGNVSAFSSPANITINIQVPEPSLTIPSYVAGTQNTAVSLGLTASDSDANATINLLISGGPTSGSTPFTTLIGNNLTAVGTYNAAAQTWTISGLTIAEINALTFNSSGNSYTLSYQAQAADHGLTSATFSGSNSEMVEAPLIANFSSNINSTQTTGASDDALGLSLSGVANGEQNSITFSGIPAAFTSDPIGYMNGAQFVALGNYTNGSVTVSLSTLPNGVTINDLVLQIPNLFSGSFTLTATPSGSIGGISLSEQFATTTVNVQEAAPTISVNASILPVNEGSSVNIGSDFVISSIDPNATLSYLEIDNILAGTLTENGVSVGTNVPNLPFSIMITDPTELANINALTLNLPAGYATQAYTLSIEAKVTNNNSTSVISNDVPISIGIVTTPTLVIPQVVTSQSNTTTLLRLDASENDFHATFSLFIAGVPNSATSPFIDGTTHQTIGTYDTVNNVWDITGLNLAQVEQLAFNSSGNAYVLSYQVKAVDGSVTSAISTGSNSEIIEATLTATFGSSSITTTETAATSTPYTALLGLSISGLISGEQFNGITIQGIPAAFGSDPIGYMNGNQFIPLGTYDSATQTVTLSAADITTAGGLSNLANELAIQIPNLFAGSFQLEATAQGTLNGVSIPAAPGNISITTNISDNSPFFTNPDHISVDENSIAITNVHANDIDTPQNQITYSIVGGDDQALFNIDYPSGALSFIDAPDYENPNDVGANNVYNITVQASDGTNVTTQNITITVNPVNDNAPSITSADSINVNERTTAVVIVTATDADLPGDTLTYSIVGGADAALFNIDSAAGKLSFISAPTVANPQDVGADNIYNVTVKVSDGNPDFDQTQDLTIHVAPYSIQVVFDDIDPNVGGVARNGFTNDTQPVIHGFAAANSVINIYDASVLLGSTTSNQFGIWDFNVNDALSDGTHVFRAKSTDNFGATFSTSSSQYTINVDTVAPNTPSITSQIFLDTGAPDDGITYSPDVQLIGTAEGNARIDIYDNGNFVLSTSADGLGNWSLSFADSGDGTHNYSTKAVDSAGNSSGFSTDVLQTIILDTSAAAPVIDKIATVDDPNTSIPNNGSTQDVNLIVSGSAEAFSSIQLYSQYQIETQSGSQMPILIGIATAGADGHWSINTSGLSEHTINSIYGIQTDIAGNVSTIGDMNEVIITDHLSVTPSVNLTVNENSTMLLPANIYNYPNQASSASTFQYSIDGGLTYHNVAIDDDTNIDVSEGTFIIHSFGTFLSQAKIEFVPIDHYFNSNSGNTNPATSSFSIPLTYTFDFAIKTGNVYFPEPSTVNVTVNYVQDFTFYGTAPGTTNITYDPRSISNGSTPGGLGSLPGKTITNELVNVPIILPLSSGNVLNGSHYGYAFSNGSTQMSINSTTGGKTATVKINSDGTFNFVYTSASVGAATFNIGIIVTDTSAGGASSVSYTDNFTISTSTTAPQVIPSYLSGGGVHYNLNTSYSSDFGTGFTSLGNPLIFTTSLLPDGTGLTLDASTGVLSGTLSRLGNYSFDVRGTDPVNHISAVVFNTLRALGDTANITFNVDRVDLSSFAAVTLSMDAIDPSNSGGMIQVVDTATGSVIPSVSVAANHVNKLQIIGTAFDDTFYANGIYSQLQAANFLANTNVTYDGAGGSNTLSFSNPNPAVTVDPNTITVNYDPLNHTGNFSDAASGSFFDVINNFQTIIGAANGTVFTLASVGNGYHFIAGSDLSVLDYSTATSAVTINLMSGTATENGLTDLVSDFKIIKGSNQGSTFISGAADEVFHGGSANTTLQYTLGTGGFDIFYGAINVNNTIELFDAHAVFASSDPTFGHIQTDTYNFLNFYNVSNFIFHASSSGSTIQGSTNGNNIFYTGSGVDIFTGGFLANNTFIYTIANANDGDQFDGNANVNGATMKIIAGDQGSNVSVNGDVQSGIMTAQGITSSYTNIKNFIYVGGLGNDSFVGAANTNNTFITDFDFSNLTLGTFVGGINGNNIYQLNSETAGLTYTLGKSLSSSVYSFLVSNKFTIGTGDNLTQVIINGKDSGNILQLYGATTYNVSPSLLQTDSVTVQTTNIQNINFLGDLAFLSSSVINLNGDAGSSAFLITPTQFSINSGLLYGYSNFLNMNVNAVGTGNSLQISDGGVNNTQFVVTPTGYKLNNLNINPVGNFTGVQLVATGSGDSISLAAINNPVNAVLSDTSAQFTWTGRTLTTQNMPTIIGSGLANSMNITNLSASNIIFRGDLSGNDVSIGPYSITNFKTIFSSSATTYTIKSQDGLGNLTTVAVLPVGTFTLSNGLVNDSLTYSTAIAANSTINLGAGSNTVLTLLAGNPTLTATNVSSIIGGSGQTLTLNNMQSGIALSNFSTISLANGATTATTFNTLTSSTNNGTINFKGTLNISTPNSADLTKTVLNATAISSSIIFGSGSNYISSISSNISSVSGVSNYLTNLTVGTAVTIGSVYNNLGSLTVNQSNSSNFTYNIMSTIKNLITGSGNDTITINNIVDGGSINLGGGTDALDFSFATSATLVVNPGQLTLTFPSNAARVNTFSGVEQITGASFAAGTGSNTFNATSGGFASGMIFIGGINGATNTFNFNAGANSVTFTGTGSNNTVQIFGNTGSANTFSMTTTTFTVNGVTSNYSNIQKFNFTGDSTASDTLQLGAGTYSLGLTNIENLNGSSGNDIVTLTNAQASQLTVDLAGGSNTLNLANGTNLIAVKNVATIVGGTGNDTVTHSGGIISGMTVDLGGGGSDIFSVTGTAATANSFTLTKLTNTSNYNITMNSVTSGLITNTERFNFTGDTATDTVTLASTFPGVYALGLTNIENLIGTGLDDAVSLTSPQSSLTVDLGGGNDTLALANGGNSISIKNVESLLGEQGNDVVLTLASSTMSVDSAIEQLRASGQGQTLTLTNQQVATPLQISGITLRDYNTVILQYNGVNTLSLFGILAVTFQGTLKATSNALNTSVLGNVTVSVVGTGNVLDFSGDTTKAAIFTFNSSGKFVQFGTAIANTLPNTGINQYVGSSYVGASSGDVFKLNNGVIGLYDGTNTLLVNYTGGLSLNDTLTFAGSPSNTAAVTIDMTNNSSMKAIQGSLTDTFSNIENIILPVNGAIVNKVMVGNTGGYNITGHFNGATTADVADFSNLSGAITLVQDVANNVTWTTGAGVQTDTVSHILHIFVSATKANDLTGSTSTTIPDVYGFIGTPNGTLTTIHNMTISSATASTARDGFDLSNYTSAAGIAWSSFSSAGTAGVNQVIQNNYVKFQQNDNTNSGQTAGNHGGMLMYIDPTGTSNFTGHTVAQVNFSDAAGSAAGTADDVATYMNYLLTQTTTSSYI